MKASLGPYARRLIDHLSHRDYAPRKLRDLIEDLGIPADEHDAFGKAVEELKKERTLEVSAGGMVSLPSALSLGKELTGRFRKTPRGFGFVSPPRAVREGSIFIPPGSTLNALSGDTVRVRLRRERRDGKEDVVGEILEVLERRRTSFAGVLARRGSQWLVFPDGRELTEPIVVRDAKANEGEKVVVEITDYPTAGPMGTTVLARGVITRVLGKAGEPDVETAATIAAYDLPGEFPEECLEQAREASDEFAQIIREGGKSPEGREDLRETFILTIDPPDAKDYDDAINITQRPDGGWELGVHIADVSRFVPAGSPIDAEARDRGNSVYLPRRVIPMIPELLSNGICSLQEAEDRFCASAFITYDRNGQVIRQRVARTIIRSAKRLTYLEAQALIDGDEKLAATHAATEPNYTPELLKALKTMDRCAKTIQARRKRQGMISLQLPESVLVYDKQGRVVDAHPEDDAYTHTLIEMFMVEANEVLGRLFEELEVPLLRRVHPDPTPGDITTMRRTAMVAGHRVPQNPTRQELQALLEATRDTPAGRAVHMAVLRTLSKAEYSPALIGHFALASTAYAHFTSPIRRYADLTVHRALGKYLELTDNGARPPKDKSQRRALAQKLRKAPECLDHDTLAEIGSHITQREINAESAERDLRTLLVLQLIEREHVGEVFAGIIGGVSAGGLFVQIDKYLIDGFVDKNDLPAEGGRRAFWKLDPKTGALTAGSRRFGPGQSVRVRIDSVDLAKRQMKLVILDDRAGSRPAPAPEDDRGGQEQGRHGHRRGGKKPGPSGPSPHGRGGGFKRRKRRR